MNGLTLTWENKTYDTVTESTTAGDVKRAGEEKKEKEKRKKTVQGPGSIARAAAEDIQDAASPTTDINPLVDTSSGSINVQIQM